jgi:glucosyl-3-phosphoglycerate synthase
MADFYQSGYITTLHRLGSPDWRALEEELYEYREARPIALVIPCLYSELQGPAIGPIVQKLSGANYLSRVVIALDRATREEYLHATQFFSELSQDLTMVWINSPGIEALTAELEEHDLPLGPHGKGRSCWISYGYILSHEEIEVIALHDADIITYNRELLARLCYPVGNPNLGFEFAKGSYARYSDRLHGRVMRLFVTPLLKAFDQVMGTHPLTSFIASFRYPLAGEFAMTTDLIRVNRIPGDWGLEVGVLAEIYRNLVPRRICQVDLCDRYDHKHQPLSPEDSSTGLQKMAIDIAKSLFRNLATEGVSFNGGDYRSLVIAYNRLAGETIRQYFADAAINHMHFDRHEEGIAVDTFTRALQIATQQFMEDPLDTILIPNWNRVLSAFPDFTDRIRDVVESDAEEARTALAGKVF